MCFPLQLQAISGGGHKPARMAPEVFSSHSNTFREIIRTWRQRGQLESRPSVLKENVTLRSFWNHIRLCAPHLEVPGGHILSLDVSGQEILRFP